MNHIIHNRIRYRHICMSSTETVLDVSTFDGLLAIEYVYVIFRFVSPAHMLQYWVHFCGVKIKHCSAYHFSKKKKISCNLPILLLNFKVKSQWSKFLPQKGHTTTLYEFIHVSIDPYVSRIWYYNITQKLSMFNHWY